MSDDADYICELIDEVAKQQTLMSKLVATKYYIKDSVPKGSGGTAITIEARDWKDGKVTAWALMRGPQRFNKKEKQFRHEPLNSSKTRGYIKLHSFSKVERAYDAYVAFRAEHPEYFQGPPDWRK